MKRQRLIELHMFAANADYDQLKEYLVANPDCCNVRGEDQETPLHWIAICGGGILVEELDINDIYANLLEFNHEADYVSAAKLLIDSGADVNAKGSGGWTSLHLAAAYGHSDLIELLISKGAALDVKDNSGKTPLDYARKNNNKENESYILSCMGQTPEVDDNQSAKGNQDSNLKVESNWIQYSDENISFSFPDCLKLKRIVKKFGSYSLVKPPDQGFLFSITLLNSDAEDSYKRNINSQNNPFNTAEKISDLVFSENLGEGTKSIIKDNTGKIRYTRYMLLLYHQSYPIGIVLNTAKEVELTEFSDIIKSIKVKKKINY